MKKNLVLGLFFLLIASLFIGCIFGNNEDLISDLCFSAYPDYEHSSQSNGELNKRYYINFKYSEPLQMKVTYYHNGIQVRQGSFSTQSQIGGEYHIPFLTNVSGEFKVILEASNGTKKSTATLYFYIG